MSKTVNQPLGAARAGRQHGRRGKPSKELGKVQGIYRDTVVP